MKRSLKVGFSFGVTSGIITTLGLMVGLAFSTELKLAVIGGIITIAIADAFSDALGMHVSQESENRHPTKEIWESTLATFLTKFFVALSFVVPVLMLDLHTAVYIGIGWGLLLLSILSYNIARKQKIPAWKAIGEHLVIAIAVIIIAAFVGNWVRTVFI